MVFVRQVWIAFNLNPFSKYPSHPRGTTFLGFHHPLIWCLETVTVWSDVKSEQQNVSQASRRSHFNPGGEPKKTKQKTMGHFILCNLCFPLHFHHHIIKYKHTSIVQLCFIFLSLRGNVETSSVWLSRGTGPTCMFVEQAHTIPSAHMWTEDVGRR